MSEDKVKKKKSAIRMHGDGAGLMRARVVGNRGRAPHPVSDRTRDDKFGSWGWRIILDRIKWTTSTSGQDGVTETVFTLSLETSPTQNGQNL